MNNLIGVFDLENRQLLAVLDQEKREVVAVSLDNNLNLSKGQIIQDDNILEDERIFEEKMKFVSEIVKDFNTEKVDFVFKDSEDKYYVINNNVIRHSAIDSEGVIRALSNYLQSTHYKLNKKDKNKLTM